MAQYGYFDDATSEYVVTDPRTPAKWINYVGTLDFGGFVDQTGGLLLCKGDPSLNRITKYIPQMPDSDFKGSTVYLRKHFPDGYQVFSALWVPTGDEYDRFECRFGLGYTRFETEFYGIRTQITVFVPEGSATAIQDIVVTNVSDTAAVVDLIPAIEYSHFDAVRQFDNADWVPQTMQSRAIEQGDHLVLSQAAFMRRGFGENYLTSNHPVASFESDRRTFFGANGYGGWGNPLSLHEPNLSNTEALRGDNMGALLHALGELAPGESRRVIVQIGQSPDPTSAPEIAKYRSEAEVDEAFADLAEFWKTYLSRLTIETPDADFDRMLNVHNPRQVFITKQWSRYLSLYQLGLGQRGIGFRDSSQDVIGVISSAPQAGCDLIRNLLTVQRRDGSAMHQYNPATMVASAGDSGDYEDRPSYYSDDHLWVVLAVTQYLKETGDFAFLDEEIPFYEKDGDDRPLETGSVRDHLHRAVAFTRGDTGTHGIPLLGFADWNDTVNLPAGAESIFTAALYGRALLELIALAELEEDDAKAAWYQDAYDEMKQRVDEVAWDGDWFVRYFDQRGEPVGSKTNAQGQIYTNAQSWAVLSGFATEERAITALDSVRERLNTKFGIKLSSPGYDGYDAEKGGVTTYPPGAKENGGIFLHSNPWVVIAETMLGRGDQAYEYYAQLNPASKNDILDNYEIEPFVYAQNILGDEHPLFGVGRNSWLSGTASWMYTAGTQYIVGVRPTYQGLIVDPCVPAAWPSLRATREFRGARYEIEVENPDGVSRGISSMEVDGSPIEGNIVPIFDSGTHRVRVVLG